jgi:hypothetical protein
VALKEARKAQEKQHGAMNYMNSEGGRGDEEYYYDLMMGGGGGMYDPLGLRNTITEMQVEKAARALKNLREKIQTRLVSTSKVRGSETRLEQLCNALKLEPFEKSCIFCTCVKTA